MQTKREMQNGCPNQQNKIKVKDKDKEKPKECIVEEKEKNKQTYFLERKRRQEMSATNVTKAGYT